MRIPYEDVIRTPNKAGFDARVSLDPTSPNVGAFADPMLPGRNLFEGTVRQVYNVASTSWGNSTACVYPNTWLRFRRVGNTFMRYSSTNGVNWLFDGQISPNPVFPDTVYYGLAACSVFNLKSVRAQIENYGDFGGCPGATIAISGQPGNATVAAGSPANLTVTAT